MSILDTNNETMKTDLEHIKRRQRRASFTYLLLSAFLCIFYRIYVFYSFGEDSIAMHDMFLIPLCGGLLPSLILILLHLESIVHRLPFNLYNSGLACLCAGNLIRGIIEMSGRSTSVHLYYWYAGAILIGISLILSILILFLRPKIIRNRMKNLR